MFSRGGSLGAGQDRAYLDFDVLPEACCLAGNRHVSYELPGGVGLSAFVSVFGNA